MKKIITLCLMISTLAFAMPAKAANEAVFSAVSDKTSYSVGDDVRISLNVNAGPFASTLSVIDFKLKISDPSVIQPVGSSPLTLGSIYTNTVTQSYANGILSAAVFIDPNNKPANRSGVIGTITLKAQKAGQAVISYDSVKATEENNEMEYVTTSASSLTVAVTGVSAQSTQPPSAVVTATRTATPQPGNAATGPREVLIFSVVAGMVLLVAYRFSKKNKIELGENMRSTLTSLIIGLLIILAVGFGGYYVVSKLRASADVNSESTSSANADINKDGKVDALDLNAIVNAISAKSTDNKYDLNDDGKADSLDLNILINNYSK